MRAAIVRGAGAGIPGPLVHRHEVDVRLVLDERLRAVAVVHVPVDDQHALDADAAAARSARRARRCRTGRIPSTRCAARGVLAAAPRRSFGGARRRTRSRRRRARRRRPRWRRPTIPRWRRCPRRAAAALGDNRLNPRCIGGRARSRARRPSRAATRRAGAGEQLGLLAQRLRDGAQTADVLGVTPPGVVASAVGVRDEGDRHSSPRRRREVHSAMRRIIMSGREEIGGRSGRDVVRRSAVRAPARVDRRGARVARCSGTRSPPADRGRRNIGHRADQTRPPLAMSIL